MSRMEEFDAISDPETFDYSRFLRHPSAEAIPSNDSSEHSIGELLSTEPTRLHDEATLSSELLQDNTNALSLHLQLTSDISSRSLDNLDSGYGSITNGLSESSETVATRKRTFNDTAMTDSTDGSIDQIKRSRQHKDSNQPSLACPYYKRNPAMCKYDSCASNKYYDMSSRLEHLKRADLYYRCERCGTASRGKGGEQALERHRLEVDCSLRPRRPLWGLDQSMWRKIRSRKGVKGKAMEVRWKDMYMISFPDVRREDVPSPSNKFRPDTQRPTPGSLEPTHYYDLGHVHEQAKENICREWIRLLPERIAASIESTLGDVRLNLLLEGYSEKYLTGVLEKTIQEVAAVPEFSMSSQEAKA
ncbi:hypothetical protein EK21DRAFT_93611 [Setomelanomma holmii]|uniref:C2H2-type domain-containing protein n=1 Tax=Setomelanomma holmii TaxID=210430 RepID=A0A9P4GXZ0_9PLEO|nr:hypothetical protein EK21DRAFT_93611 [Setomelanomma holmii]